MDVKHVYFEVGNTFLYRISIGFVIQPVRAKFSVVFLSASNSILVIAFNLPLYALFFIAPLSAPPKLHHNT